LVGGASAVTACEVWQVPVETRRTSTKPLPAGVESLALGRPTRQSSTLQASGPERAVDGDPSPGLASPSVSSTAHELQPWWEVDLGESHQIDTIRVWNQPG